MNPVSGGIPANEHISTSRIKYVDLFFWLILICVVVFMLEYVINMKIGVTVIKYSIRYVIHIVGVFANMIIHPRCLIDEYARIVRRFVWFSPMIPPIVVPLIAIKAVCFGSELVMYENDNRISGAIFCHVDRRKQFIHERDVITDGNHRWHGAAPSFSNKDVIRIIVATLLFIIVLINIDDLRRRSIEPKA